MWIVGIVWTCIWYVCRLICSFVYDRDRMSCSVNVYIGIYKCNDEKMRLYRLPTCYFRERVYTSERVFVRMVGYMVNHQFIHKWAQNEKKEWKWFSEYLTPASDPIGVFVSGKPSMVCTWERMGECMEVLVCTRDRVIPILRFTIESGDVPMCASVW